jgi:hypothetical protein
MISLDRAPFRLLIALAWAAAWGLRTVVVRMLDALTTTAPVAVYLDVGVAVAGAAALIVGLAVLAGSGFARFVVVTALLVFTAVEAGAATAGDPVAVTLVAVNLAAATLVWRTSLADKADRSNHDVRTGTRIGVN